MVSDKLPRCKCCAGSCWQASLSPQIYPFTYMAGPSWNYVLKFIITGET